MKALISILLVTLAGCASKPQPVEWCKQYEAELLELSPKYRKIIDTAMAQGEKE